MAKDRLQAVAKDIVSSLAVEHEDRLDEDVRAVEEPVEQSFAIPHPHKGTNWTAIRMDYVMAPQLQTRQALATKYKVDLDILNKRARIEHWKGERVRFRTEMEEKVKSLAAQGLAVSLVQWDAECLQIARVLLGACMQELVNGVPTKDVHAAIATAQKVGLEALGRSTGEGSHPEAQEDVVRVLEDYAEAISSLTPALPMAEEQDVTDDKQEEEPTDTACTAPIPENKKQPVANPVWVER